MPYINLPVPTHYILNTNDLHVATAARIHKQAPNRRSIEGLQYFRWFAACLPPNESNDVASESLACTDDMISRFLSSNSSRMYDKVSFPLRHFNKEGGVSG